RRGPGPRRGGDRGGNRGGPADSAPQRPRRVHPPRAGAAPAAAKRRPAPVACVPRRGDARVQRRQAPQPCKKRDCGVTFVSLKSKIENNKAVVGVIGLGYVGLPLLAAFHRAGFPTLGFDVDPNKINALKKGESYLKHLGPELVTGLHKGARFDATADFGRMGEADVLISCVPTPLGKHLEPDLSYVEKTADDIARTLRPGQLVVLESTTYPRTTREVMLPRFEAKGLKCGRDFFLAFSPEREDPGRKDHNTVTIPKLVGSIDAPSTAVAAALYRRAVKQVVEVSSAEVAESAKLLENIYRAVNIALVNEMKIVLAELGIDIWEVVEAARTKPFGFQAF